MTDPLRVKILGNGSAAAIHRAVFQAMPMFYSIETGYSDCNLVSSCVTNYAHYGAITEALNVALPIVAEKPVCASLEECDKLIELQQYRPDQPIFPVFQCRFAGHEPITDQDMVIQWRRPLKYWEGWRGVWGTAYGGVLTSHGIHMIDLAIAKHGMPEKVSATLEMTLPGVAVETRAVVKLYFDKSTLPLTIIVEAGPDITQGGFYLGESMAGYIDLFAKIHKTLTQGEEPPVTIEDARNALEVLTAAYYSAYTNKVVSLPIHREHPFYNGWHEAFAQRALQLDKPCPTSPRTRE